MYNKPILSLDQTRKAMEAMLDKATQDLDHPVAIAIVDDNGDILDYARTDRCRKGPQRMAMREAYTCAISGQDSKGYAAGMTSQDRTVAEMGDPMLAAAQGGATVSHPGSGAIIGGGVSALASEDDEAIAKVGLQAMGLEA